MVAGPSQLTVERAGRWLKAKAKHRTPAYWHWVHRSDPTAYCGIPKPTDVADVEPTYEPMVRACRKCIARIQREGY